MRTITKSECLALIERLAEKGECLSCDANGLVSECGDIFQYPYRCPICNGEKNNTRALPVVIGDVLEKFHEENPLKDEYFKGLEKTGTGILIKLWRDCGFSRSLQEILEGWVDGSDDIIGKEAELFLFLNEIL